MRNVAFSGEAKAILEVLFIGKGYFLAKAISVFNYIRQSCCETQTTAKINLRSTLGKSITFRRVLVVSARAKKSLSPDRP